jgi:hypothetical protein
MTTMPGLRGNAAVPALYRSDHVGLQRARFPERARKWNTPPAGAFSLVNMGLDTPLVVRACANLAQGRSPLGTVLPEDVSS